MSIFVAIGLINCLSSRCPLVLSSRRHLVFLPCLSSSSRCTALSSSHCAGWLLLRRLSARRRLVLSSSSHCAALLLFHRAIWLLRPLLLGCCLVLSSSSHCAALSSSNHASWLLRHLLSCRHLVFSSRRTLVLLSSSHCAALSPSHCAIWLVRRLSSRRRLVLSSSSHSQRHSRRPRRWRSLSPAASDVKRCRRGGPRHHVIVAITIALDAISYPPTLSP